MRLFHNLFCRDIERQLRFYGELLGLPEAVHARSPIYRAIEAPGFQFGFHASAAYSLLGLDDRRPPVDGLTTVTGYPTFMLDAHGAVSAGAARCAGLGGRVIKPPYGTYYGEWQAVLADPEGHAFRLSCSQLPDGMRRPALPSAVSGLSSPAGPV